MHLLYTVGNSNIVTGKSVLNYFVNYERVNCQVSSKIFCFCKEFPFESKDFNFSLSILYLLPVLSLCNSKWFWSVKVEISSKMSIISGGELIDEDI